MDLNQSEYDVRCEWGLAGLAHLQFSSDVLIIVDVLSFSTSVELAVGNGAIIYPYPYGDEIALIYAQSLDAELAGSPGKAHSPWSLSPASLLRIPAGKRLVLPSPNGAALSFAVQGVPALAGCLRNANATAAASERLGRRISVIPAGERWEDGSLRPALEDLAGAGAVISSLGGRKSPEAEIAQAAFRAVEKTLFESLRDCSSGKELAAKGREKDIELAAALNLSQCVPILENRAYTRCASFPD